MKPFFTQSASLIRIVLTHRPSAHCKTKVTKTLSKWIWWGLVSKAFLHTHKTTLYPIEVEILSGWKNETLRCIFEPFCVRRSWKQKYEWMKILRKKLCYTTILFTDQSLQLLACAIRPGVLLANTHINMCVECWSNTRGHPGKKNHT